MESKLYHIFSLNYTFCTTIKSGMAFYTQHNTNLPGALQIKANNLILRFHYKYITITNEIN